MIDVIKVLGRTNELFVHDLKHHEKIMCNLIRASRFLVIGAAGSIGKAVTQELFTRGADAIHCVDVNENGLTELVRYVRSNDGYTTKDFKIFALDIISREFDLLCSTQRYDYILNLSALKHVRSEENPFTMRRMIDVNIVANRKILQYANESSVKKMFCVSTDKAANPSNFMGATKKLMEEIAFLNADETSVSTARFANVAFSNGSLLSGFVQRIQNQQPITIPLDVRRYFITEREAALICLFSLFFGENREIFVPNNDKEIRLTSFKEILENYLATLGKVPKYCASEAEARFESKKNICDEWPIFAFESDTSGEKLYEEFFTASELIDTSRFCDLAVVSSIEGISKVKEMEFFSLLSKIDVTAEGARDQLIDLLVNFVPSFKHQAKLKSLNGRM